MKVMVVGFNDFYGNFEFILFVGVMVFDFKDLIKQVKLMIGGIEVIGGYFDQECVKNVNLIFVGVGDLIGVLFVMSSLLWDEFSVIGLSKFGMQYSSLGNYEFDQGYKELLWM